MKSTVTFSVEYKVEFDLWQVVRTASKLVLLACLSQFI